MVVNSKTLASAKRQLVPEEKKSFPPLRQQEKKGDGVLHFDHEALRQIGVDPNTPLQSDAQSELRMDSPTGHSAIPSWRSPITGTPAAARSPIASPTYSKISDPLRNSKGFAPHSAASMRKSTGFSKRTVPIGFDPRKMNSSNGFSPKAGFSPLLGASPPYTPLEHGMCEPSDMSSHMRYSNAFSDIHVNKSPLEAIEETVELLMALPEGGYEVGLLHESENRIRHLKKKCEEEDDSETSSCPPEPVHRHSMRRQTAHFKAAQTRRATLVQAENKEKADKAKLAEDEFFAELNRISSFLKAIWTKI